MREPGQAPPITEVELHGIETIPPEDRTAKPLDLFRLTFGGANTFATVVLGAFPILIFGLSFWQGFLAAVLGVVIGGLILMPMALFGPVNGTNNAVSSGAHFGVVGRIVGSFLSLLTAITFFAISVYTSGDILIGALDELVGTGQPEWLLAIGYGFFAVVVLVICLYGFQFMLAVNKVAVIGATALYLVGAIAYAGDFDAGYAGVVGSDSATLIPAFIGGTLLVMANPLSFGAFLGDWSRYIPASASRKHLMLAAFGAQVATLIPFTFGLATASIIAVAAPDAAAAGNYAGGLVEITPGWFLLPVCIIAVIGGLSTGTTALYGTGLDFSSVFPVFSRFQSTVLIGTLSIGDHLPRPLRARLRADDRHVRDADHHLHDAVGGDHDHRLHRAARLVRPRRAAGLQPAAARRALLVHGRRELPRDGGLDPRRGHRPAVREHPRSVRGADAQHGRGPRAFAVGGRRHLLGGGDRAGRRAVRRVPVGGAGAACGVRARRASVGADDGRRASAGGRAGLANVNPGWVEEAGMPAARAVPGALNGHMPVKAPCVWRPRSGRHPSSPTQPQLTFAGAASAQDVPGDPERLLRRTGRPRPGTAIATSATRRVAFDTAARSGSPKSTASRPSSSASTSRPPSSSIRGAPASPSNAHTPTPVSSTATLSASAISPCGPRPPSDIRRSTRASTGVRTTSGSRPMWRKNTRWACGTSRWRMAIASAPVMRSAMRRSRSRSSRGVGAGAASTSVHASHRPGCSAATRVRHEPAPDLGLVAHSSSIAGISCSSLWLPNVVRVTSPPRRAKVIWGQTATA